MRLTTQSYGIWARSEKNRRLSLLKSGVATAAVAVLLAGCASSPDAPRETPSTTQPTFPTETPDPAENDPAGLYRVGLGHIKYEMGPRELDTGLQPIWLERTEPLPSPLVEMYNEPLEDFIQRPKEEQWKLVSYLSERKADYDLIYAAINRKGDYDPTQSVDLDSSAEQLWGYGQSWDRFALSFIDKKLDDNDPNTPPVVDRNEFLKILAAISYDPSNHIGFQRVIELSNGQRYYDVRLAARSKAYESYTDGYEIVSRGATYKLDGYIGAVDVTILQNDTELTSKRLFFEYIDHKGNKAIGYQYTAAR
jgi:hypothetical protein